MSDGVSTGRAQAGIWHSLNRFLVVLILLAASVPIAYSFIPEVRRHREHERKIDELKGRIERERMLLQRHLREEKLLISDPEYVSIVARDRLDLMKEGETIYRLDMPRPESSRMRRNP